MQEIIDLVNKAGAEQYKNHGSGYLSYSTGTSYAELTLSDFKDS